MAFYRTLLKKVPVYILDEPTASLDTGNIERISQVIRSVPAEFSVIIVSHNDEFLKNVCGRIYNLSSGKLNLLEFVPR